MSRHLSIAYQLYSAREDMANDVEGTLAQVAGMGYRGVEFAGFFERSAKDINKLMKKTGLTPFPAMCPCNRFAKTCAVWSSFTRISAANTLPCRI